jgi:hypothetical protein
LIRSGIACAVGIFIGIQGTFLYQATYQPEEMGKEWTIVASVKTWDGDESEALEWDTAPTFAACRDTAIQYLAWAESESTASADLYCIYKVGGAD